MVFSSQPLMSINKNIDKPGTAGADSSVANSSKDQRPDGALRRLSSWPVRLIGTLAFLILIANMVDLPAAANLLGNARWDLILFGWLVTALLMVCALAEWAVLVRSIKPVKWSYLTSVFILMFAPGMILPADIGGEAVRIYKLAPHIGVERATATALLARASSSLALAVWAFAGSVMVKGELAVLALISACIFLSATLAVWSLAFLPAKIIFSLTQRLARSRHQLIRRATSFVSALADLGTHRRALTLSLFFSLLGWGLNFFALNLFALSVGASPPWYVFALALPLSLAATVAPFLVDGMGLREGILIAAFVHAGMSSEQAGVIALLVDLQLVPFVLMSLVAWMWPDLRNAGKSRAGAITDKKTAKS